MEETLEGGRGPLWAVVPMEKEIIVHYDLYEYDHFHIHMDLIILYGSTERNE
jgi:hypothetical protein